MTEARRVCPLCERAITPAEAPRVDEYALLQEMLDHEAAQNERIRRWRPELMDEMEEFVTKRQRVMLRRLGELTGRT